MHTVRAAAVAGTFYPGQAEALSDALLRLLADAGTAPHASSPIPKALIVPHAGYIYSGSTAALAFARLRAARGRIHRVVLLGPVHHVPLRGLALPGVAAFATPLGEVAIDPAGVAALAGLSQVCENAAAHAREHSLEVQLPFLQLALDDFKLLPLAVGDATASEVAEVLEVLWGDAQTLILISSDLSHFLPYAQAQALDDETVQRIMTMNGPLSHQQACGATPINGLLLAARRHGLKPELLGLCNSGDSAGDKRRVVGYAAIAFLQAGRPEISDNQGASLLAIARASIAAALGHSGTVADRQAWLLEPGACFVTLTQDQQLRGCIGSLQARRSLLADIEANAVAAALHDPRFTPLTLAELASTEIEVSLLSPLQGLAFESEAQALAQLKPGIDGLVFECGQHRSTFLPQVWEQLPAPARFMAQLKRKAGLPADFWSSDVKLSRYTVRKFRESELMARPGASHQSRGA